MVRHLLAQRGQLLAQGVVLQGQRDDALAQLGRAFAQCVERIGDLGGAAGVDLGVAIGAVQHLLGRLARLALGLAHTLGGLLELVLAGSGCGTLFVFRQVGHGGRGADRDHPGLDRFHQFRRGLLVDALDHRHLAAAQARFAGHVRAADLRCGGPRRAVFVSGLGRPADLAVAFLLQLGLIGAMALGQDVALAQRQHATLEIGDAAAAQVLLDHPQMDVVHRLESRVLDRLERQAVLLADAVAVVAIHQHLAPQHQRVAAAFGEDAALQGVVLVRGQRVDIGLEFFFDDNVHAIRYASET